MIPRKLSAKILEWAGQYPVVTVTGPRQSGKTTLCRNLFPEWVYVSLEDPDQRSFARDDPRGFLAARSGGVILDEIQEVPELVSYIQTRVDESGDPGQYLLTGSRQFELMESVSQSLAGRTAVARLYPFSLSELYPDQEMPELDRILQTGFYPRIHDQGLDASEAMSFYISTFLERDVRKVLQVKDLAVFETFLGLCAGRTGQLLNLHSLGNECGVTHNTIKSWISVLQAGGILTLLRPWHSNPGKRLVKTPKLYFLDTGLACALLGIRKPEHLQGHPLRGALFETFVVSEVVKQLAHAGREESLWFYRDSNGNEVDLLMGMPGRLRAWEIKSAMTLKTDMFKPLHKMDSLPGGVQQKGLIYNGEETYERQGVRVEPWSRMGERFLEEV